MESEAHRMPVWVKVLLGAAILALVAFLALHLTGNAPGGHAP